MDTDKHISDGRFSRPRRKHGRRYYGSGSQRSCIWGDGSEVLQRLPEIEEYICSNGAVVVEQKGNQSKVIFHQSFSNEEGLWLLISYCRLR